MENLSDEEIRARIANKVKKLYASKKKKYVCEFCGTGFNKRDFLMSHMKIRHPEEYDLKYGESNYASLSPDILTQMMDTNSDPLTIANADAGLNDLKNNTVHAESSTLNENPIGNQKKLEASKQTFPPSIGSTPQKAENKKAEMNPLPSSYDASIGNISQQTDISRVATFPPNIDFNDFNINLGQTIPPANLSEIDQYLDNLSESLTKTIKVMNMNMQMLNKELRYLIAEYKSPFIIFE